MEWKVKFNVDKVVYAVEIIFIPNKLKICYLIIKKKKKLDYSSYPREAQLQKFQDAKDTHSKNATPVVVLHQSGHKALYAKDRN